jgi:DNA-binding GntR family transcriptional regulator
LALESMAAALAVVHISDREVKDLISIYELMKAQHDSPGADFLALNQGFHFTIYRSASRPILLAMIETLWLQTGPWLSDAVHGRGGRLELQHHQFAIVALTERNSKAASRAVAAAIISASNLMAGITQSRGPVSSGLRESADKDAKPTA